MSLTRTTTQPKKYLLDGDDAKHCALAELPGVTDVLADAGYINKERYENFGADGFFRDRGTYIHEACDMVDRGIALDSASIQGYEGYISAYQEARQQMPVPAALEESFYDGTLLYAGTRDRRYDGALYAVGDLKSAQQSAPWWRLQLAAYALPLGPPYPAIFDLQLNGDGTYRFFKIDNEKYLAAAFLFTAALVNYHKKRKLPIRNQEALALAAVSHLSALRAQFYEHTTGTAVEAKQVHRVLSTGTGALQVAEGETDRDAEWSGGHHEENASCGS